MSTPTFLQRLELLVGPNVIERLRSTKVAVFGLGGVGGWCVEALARNGIGKLTIIDSDYVCLTNINRQLQATHKTVGSSKVKLLQERLLDINPDIEICTKHEAYNRSTRDGFDPSQFDYVIDAIDSLGNKVDLLESALASNTTVFSALGASRKLDPTRVEIGSFWKVIGCPLGKHLRKRLRNRGINKDFLCVYSSENLPAYPVDLPCGSGDCHCSSPDGIDKENDWCSKKKQINGSSVHITATFGLFLAGMVVNDIKAKVGDSLDISKD